MQQAALSGMVASAKEVPVKLMVAIPAGGMVNLDFMNCVVYMSMFIMRAQLPIPLRRGNLFEIVTKRGSMLPVLRQELVEAAIDLEADFMLFLDTDQLFPANTAHRLMMHDKDVVACNIATKLLPPDTGPTATKYNGKPEGDPVYSTPDKRGLERVWRVGCGVMMLKPRIFRNIPKPWFKFEWDSEHGRFHGEDWHMCEVLERAGIDIWVDHDLSRDVGHEGFAIYTHDMANMSKQVREEHPEDFSEEGRHNDAGIIATSSAR